MLKRRSQPYLNHKGFSLPELLIATFILATVFLGMLWGIVKSMELNEMADNTTKALIAAKNRVAQIEDTAFSNIVSTYQNTTFAAGDLNGIGVTYVSDTNPQLLQVTISFCWKQKNGRVLGEDTNLNGTLDAGEDVNGNGIIDSPVKVTMAISNV